MELSLEFQLFSMVPDSPIVLLTKRGTCPDLASILLNSHMDVVPVFEDKWRCDPFSADIIDGKIYGRGTQDMKSVGIQSNLADSRYLEAIRRIVLENKDLDRTVHILFVPDEELGGSKGMQPFVQSAAFKNLNIGIALDEGVAHPDNKILVFYGERAPWWIKVEAHGNTGHGSQFIKNSAVEKLVRRINLPDASYTKGNGV